MMVFGNDEYDDHDHAIDGDDDSLDGALLVAFSGLVPSKWLEQMLKSNHPNILTMLTGKIMTLEVMMILIRMRRLMMFLLPFKKGCFYHKYATYL